MLVSFNGHFIEAQSYRLMMSLVGIAQAQVPRKGTATAVGPLAVYGQDTLPTLPYQAKWAVEEEP